MFDYRAMNRFGINVADVPRDSVLHNKPLLVQMFEGYRWHVLGVIFLLAAQTLAVTLLLINRARRKRSELALRDSEERFRSTFEQAAVGIAHVRPDGRFLRINQGFCDIVGYSIDEMLECTFQDITHPDDLEADLGHMRKLLAREVDRYSIEKRYYHKNGETVWVNLTVSLLREDTGQPRYFVSIVEDITRRKHAEQLLRDRQQRLRTLASQLTMAEEHERHRIAAVLHDRFLQILSFARLRLAAGKAVTGDKQAAILDEVSDSLL